MRVWNPIWLRRVQRTVVNPWVTRFLKMGIPDPGDALLETTGWRTGQLRLTPVCDCLEGDTFWVVSQRGRRSDWVKNIEANPRVRINVRRGSRSLWRSGTAHILDRDNTRDRISELRRGHPARSLCLQTSSRVSTEPLTVRVDLDPNVPAGQSDESWCLAEEAG